MSILFAISLWVLSNPISPSLSGYISLTHSVLYLTSSLISPHIKFVSSFCLFISLSREGYQYPLYTPLDIYATYILYVQKISVNFYSFYTPIVELGKTSWAHSRTVCIYIRCMCKALILLL